MDCGDAAHAQDVLKLAGNIRTVINTHWHLESTGANDTMAKAGAKLVSQVSTQLWMTQEIIHDWEKKVFPPRAKEARPSETFYTTGKTTFGGEPVEYGIMPVAHTDGDIYVYFTQSNVLMAGDAVQPGRLPLLDWPCGGWIGGMQDAQRTLGLVRQHAAQWHVDPHKVGVIGFSAGGHLVAAVSTHFAQRTYPPVDAADALSCRPDFAIAVYPGHLWAREDENHATRNQRDLSLRPDIRVRADTPPTFLLQAENDDVDGVEQSLAYYVALQEAGVPTELHLYAKGGHAFGLRATNLPIGRWPQLVEQWLHTVGMLGSQQGR